MNTTVYKRITKSQAKQCFYNGEEIYLIPCKMMIGDPWNIGCLISDSKYYTPHAKISRWDIMYNNWAYYNISWEKGYYAHYYVERQKDENRHIISNTR